MAAVELPRIVAGRYRPIRLLGRGGMGVVYEVEHVRTGQRLALKVLAASLAANPQFVQRFQREARASGQIKSEHVVTVTDADVAPELGNAPFVVMELLDGTDLEARIGTAMEPPERVVGWLRQIARALDKAHRLGIVHRDLKPANLFLTSRDDGSDLVKILDFGIAKMVDGIVATSTGEMVGTPAYMSPEQARGDVDITGAADRFALGLIAYRLLCGEMYWRTRSIAQLVNEILYAPLESPSSRGSTLGPGFDEWFARATMRAPAARFGTVTEQVEALARALGLSTLPQGELVTPAHVSPPSVSPFSTGSFYNAETLTAGPGEEPTHPSLALAPTEQTSPRPARSRARGRGRAGAAIAGALVAAIGVVAFVGRARVAPPPMLAASASPAPSSSAAPPASSVSPPASAPAPAAGMPDAAPAPLPRPRTVVAPRSPGGPRPASSADPFGDQK